jgi:hypothetical protein
MRTIRQALRGWYRFLGVGLIGVGILAGNWRPFTWPSYYLRMAVLGFLLVSVVGVFVFGFRCPRCRASLLLKATAILSGGKFACPKCGVGMDEKIS